MEESLRLSLWSTTGATQATASQLLLAAQQAPAVAWVTARANQTTVHGALVRLGLQGLGAEVVDRLLRRPAREDMPIDTEGLNDVAATLVAVRSADEARPVLDQWPVRIVASRRWVLVLTWPNASGAEPPDIHVLAKPGRATSASSAQDLALEILLAIAGTLDGAARALTHQLHSASPEAADRLRAIARRVDELQLLVADVRRPGRDPDTAWFSEADGRARGRGLVAVLDAVDRQLNVLSRDAHQRVTEHRAELERRRAEVNQRVLGTLAALLLGPSLVASLLDAFPQWLPTHQRDDAMLGLSVAAAGAIWLLVALVSQRPGRWYARPISGALAIAVGVLVAWPLDEGSDGQPPELSVTCPKRPRVGTPATATVIASDPEGHLEPSPSGTRPVNTSSLGVHVFTVRATDSFGHPSTASCAYRVITHGQTQSP